MLQALRSGAAGWVAKIFFGLLVLSFAVWGIEDVFRIGRTAPTVATVGERQITVEDFRTAYNNELRRISNQAKRVITPEQARMAGIGDKVLSDMINEAAIDSKIAGLGLSISDDAVVREIQTDDTFQGPTGSFDRNAFREILRQNNLSENQYLALQRSYSKREQLIDALRRNVEAPEAFARAIHAFNSDSRSITYLALKAEEPAAVPAPSADALKAYFEERKDSFSAPDYRKIAVLSLDPKALAATKTISDDRLKSYYEANQPKYADLEKRSIEQISFPTLDEAKAASDKIKAGALFEQVWAERKLKPEDVYLGDLTKAQMFDKKIADAAFSLPMGQVSGPVEGAFSTVLLRVTGVQQQKLRPFDEVKDEIRAVLGEEEARKEVLAIHDKIDEARLGGATLEEAAKPNGLKVRIIEAVDRAGAGPDGKPIAELPMQDKVVEAAFRTDVGADAGTLNEGDAYAWIDVLGVTPSRERTFDEARAAVETRWREDEAQKRLDARSDQVLADLKAGKSFEDVAAGRKLEVEQAETTRLGGAPSVTAEQAKAIFQTKVEEFGQTPPDERGGRLVYRVTAENERPYEPGKADDGGQLEKISQSMANDLVSALVKQIRDQLGTKIDPAAVTQVTGGAS